MVHYYNSLSMYMLLQVQIRRVITKYYIGYSISNIFQEDFDIETHVTI